jgi:hypothetical protein
MVVLLESSTPKVNYLYVCLEGFHPLNFCSGLRRIMTLTATARVVALHRPVDFALTLQLDRKLAQIVTDFGLIIHK